MKNIFWGSTGEGEDTRVVKTLKNKDLHFLKGMLLVEVAICGQSYLRQCMNFVILLV